MIIKAIIFVVCALLLIGFLLSIIEWMWQNEKRKNIQLAAVALYLIGGIIYVAINFLFCKPRALPSWEYEKIEDAYNRRFN